MWSQVVRVTNLVLLDMLVDYAHWNPGGFITIHLEDNCQLHFTD